MEIVGCSSSVIVGFTDATDGTMGFVCDRVFFFFGKYFLLTTVLSTGVYSINILANLTASINKQGNKLEIKRNPK